jgi:hypothetical protein
MARYLSNRGTFAGRTRNTQPAQPPQEPTYEKCEDDEHAERFKKIKGFKFTGERKFDFINLQR